MIAPPIWTLALVGKSNTAHAARIGAQKTFCGRTLLERARKLFAPPRLHDIGCQVCRKIASRVQPEPPAERGKQWK